MPTCIVKKCGNRTSIKSAKQEALEKNMKITFHRLPKDAGTRQLWLNNLGIDDPNVRSDAVICSLHFMQKDFDRTSLACVRLREHAIPYLQVPEEVQEESSIVHNIQVMKETSSAASSSSSSHLVLRLVLMDHSYVLTEPVKIQPQQRLPTSMDHDYTSLSANDKGVQAQVTYEDKGTCISPERIFNSPDKLLLREHAAKMKKQYQNELKLLKQKCKRSDVRIANLKTTLKTLQEKNSLEGPCCKKAKSLKKVEG